MIDPGVWRGRRVLLTGHTGFKGAWLALWLAELGAEVHGLSGPPVSEPSLYEVEDVREGLAGEHDVDVRDADALRRAVAVARPEVVFHLAAQAIVRRSLREPAETFAVNVTGTAHLLEALGAEVPTVVVTSDKCYRDVASGRPMREDDALGGKDPYSASKAAQELVAAAHRETFGAPVATARAGNVIGGGDWAADRLVPDIFRARAANRPVVLRNPDAVRPWQHVLNPLSGYLMLAERLLAGEAADAFNFGPDRDDEQTVSWVVDRLGADAEVRPDPDADKESPTLRLDSTKARQELGWEPRWTLEQGLAATVEWFDAFSTGQAATRDQILRFPA
ncbi:MAG: CDP-glucose 4,6-dehydratase [Solirubrobacteraceae bacterium]|nr:CDP-glucose 4,6-dehydratase [Solirubrobacteraceae bacterium]